MGLIYNYLTFAEILQLMRILVKISLIITFIIFNYADAQTVVRKDTIAGTELSYTMDRDIEKAMQELEERCTVANTKKNYNDDDDNHRPVSVPSKTTSPSTKVVPSRKLTNAEICKQNPKVLGYKIQLTVVKSNEEANEVKAYFRRRFPNLKAQTDASLRPNYKILAGSYFTKQSASADLAKIRQYFKSAIAVEYTVFCVEAK